jgi:hypothetical protein
MKPPSRSRRRISLIELGSGLAGSGGCNHTKLLDDADQLRGSTAFAVPA